MPKKPKGWYLALSKESKPTVPAAIKEEVETKGKRLVEEVLKPKHVETPPEEPRFNYIIDISTKWHGSYFYFIATYACPGPNAISPSFESPFARLEFVGNGRFNLSYMRHTGKWFELFQRLTLDECLDVVENDPNFLA